MRYNLDECCVDEESHTFISDFHAETSRDWREIPEMVHYVKTADASRRARGYYIFLSLLMVALLLGPNVSNINAIAQDGDTGTLIDAWGGKLGRPSNDESPHSGDCRVCHDVHGGMGRGLLVADNSTELCGMCHILQYESYMDSNHYLTGVLCTDCHGYDVNAKGDYRVNHSFSVDEPLACGQSVSCHEDTIGWALDQLEIIPDTFHALSEDLTTEINRLQALLEDYRTDPDADPSLVNEVDDAIDNALQVAQDYSESSAVHDWREVWNELTVTINDLVAARAAIYEARSPIDELVRGDITIPTEYVTVTMIMEVPGGPQLLFAAAASISMVVSLCVGVIIGRRFYT
jgi:predicted CXXCH cytochrome family protein